MSSEQQQRIRRGDAIRQTSTDYDTDAQAEVAEAIAEQWGEGESVSDIADAAGRSPSFTRVSLNEYFEVVERGDNPADQRVEGEGEGEATAAGGAEVDEDRVALLADWYGVSEEKARTLAAAEAQTGIELRGDERVGHPETDPNARAGDEPDGDPEPSEEGDAEPEQAAAGAMQKSAEVRPVENVPATEEAMQAYRLGFQDGFAAGREME